MSDKLVVPDAWQAPVRRAIADLMARTGEARHSVTVTRVDETAWSAPPAGPDTPAGQTDDGRVLDVWLMARARTFRYVVALPDGQPVPRTDAP